MTFSFLYIYSKVCFYKPRPPIFPIDWLKLSLDDKTANKMLWISDSGSKVCRRTEEVCPVLDRPERYEYSPQVSLIFFFFCKLKMDKMVKRDNVFFFFY